MSTLTCPNCRIRIIEIANQELCDICQIKKEMETLEARMKNVENQLGTTAVIIEGDSDSILDNYTIGTDDIISEE